MQRESMTEIIFECIKCKTLQGVELRLGEAPVECYACDHINLIRVREGVRHDGE